MILVTTMLAPAARAEGPTEALTPARLARLERSGGPLPADHAVRVRYEGTLVLEGHYAYPHETKNFHSTRLITIAAPGIARQDWTTWSEDDTARSTETTLLLEGRVLRRDAAGAPFRVLEGREAREASYAIVTAAPALAAARARAADGRGLEGGPSSTTQSRYSWPDSIGKIILYLDPIDQPVTWTTLLLDPRRGSLANDMHYFGCSTLDGRVWPDSLRSDGYPAEESWVLYEGRVGGEESVPLLELVAPQLSEPAMAMADTVPRIAAVAPGVWSVELPDADTRSLAVEFADHLVLLETSSDVPHGERLRSALRSRFPRKPVRWVAFSHYHPAYTGGLRAFLADSAAIVCAPSLGRFVDEIAHQNFSMDPDRLWRLRPGGVSARFDSLVAGRWSHADMTNELVAIDIGARSQHTDAYVVFWMPRQKLLFEGDLGFFTSGGTIRASRRAGGLVQAIDEARVTPLTVVQSWPVKGNPASLPFAKLRELAAAPAPR